MTEAEWLACADPEAMLQFLQHTRGGRKDWRKFWLFSCACCRSVWHLLGDARCRRVVEVGERYADGECTNEELAEASEEALCRRTDLVTGSVEEAGALATFPVVVDPSYADNMTPRLPAENACFTTQEIIEVLSRSVTAGDSSAESRRERVIGEERRSQAALVRCVFGNPFRPARQIPHAVLRTLSGIVPNMALATYEDRRFDRLPVLADALEDAGCDDEAILSHLRSPGPHVRGCWVVDLFLGKE